MASRGSLPGFTGVMKRRANRSHPELESDEGMVVEQTGLRRDHGVAPRLRRLPSCRGPSAATATEKTRDQLIRTMCRAIDVTGEVDTKAVGQYRSWARALTGATVTSRSSLPLPSNVVTRGYPQIWRAVTRIQEGNTHHRPHAARKLPTHRLRCNRPVPREYLPCH
jgi:hypothetical protein